MNPFLLIFLISLLFESPIFAQQTNPAITAYSAHPSKEMFAAGDSSGKIRLYDGGGVEKAEYQIKEKVNSLAFSDERILVSGGSSLHLLEVSDGAGVTEKASSQIFDGSLTGLRFSPDGKKAVGIAPNGNEPYLVEIGNNDIRFSPIPFAAGSGEKVFASGAAYASLAAFTGNGDETAVCSFNGDLLFHDAKNKKTVKKKRKFFPVDLLFVPGGEITAALKDSSIAVFEAKNFKKTESLKTGLVFEKARIHYIGNGTIILSTPGVELTWKMGEKKFTKKELKGLAPSECGSAICVKQVSDRGLVIYKPTDPESAKTLNIP